MASSNSASSPSEISPAPRESEVVLLLPHSEANQNPLAIIIGAEVESPQPLSVKFPSPRQTVQIKNREDPASPALRLPAPETSTLDADSKIPTYSKAVRGSEEIRHLSHHTISVDDSSGEHISLIPEDVIENQAPLWDDFLVGQFPEKAPHIGKVHVIVNKIWALADKSIRIDAFVENDTTIKFRIRDKRLRERILRRGIWNIADKPMFMSKYGPEGSIEDQPELSSIPIWITLKNIPPNMFSWKGISFIASAAGAPKKLHPDTEACKDFDVAKVYVVADLTKDLPTEVRFKSRSGIDSKVQYGYPWLPPRCTKCIKWGHLATTCRKNKAAPSTPDAWVEDEALKQSVISSEENVNNENVNDTANASKKVECMEFTAKENTSAGNLEVGSTSSGIHWEKSEPSENEAWTTIPSPPGSPQVAQKPLEDTVHVTPSRFAVLLENPTSPFELVDPQMANVKVCPQTDHHLSESEINPFSPNKCPPSPSILPLMETRARRGNSKPKVPAESSKTTAASNKKKNKKKH